MAIVNWSRRKVGGVEAYLDELFADLAEQDVSVAFWHETDEPRERERIALPEGTPSWCEAECGRQHALDELRAWHPDVLYVHGIREPDLEVALQQIAPTVFFLHAYHGTCISGTKTTSSPQVRPCGRRFGRECLLHYYPRGCGGLNPRTMWSDYRLQARRLAVLSGYQGFVAASEHMRQEYERHGVDRDRLFHVPFGFGNEAGPETDVVEHKLTATARRLLFLGRMDRLKGGDVLLEALPKVRAAVGLPLHVVFGGDGPKRLEWEAQAARLAAADPQIRIAFPGWMSESEREAELRQADLLVLPSLWPEPFGRVGPEAGLAGLPVAAFDVGGVGDWLKPGVNGQLASGEPPTAAGLADAIVDCLADESRYAALRAGASREARRVTRMGHVKALMAVFERVISGARPTATLSRGAASA